MKAKKILRAVLLTLCVFGIVNGMFLMCCYILRNEPILNSMQKMIYFIFINIVTFVSWIFSYRQIKWKD